MRSASLESRRMQKEWRHFIQRVDYTSSPARSAFKKASARHGRSQNERALILGFGMLVSNRCTLSILNLTTIYCTLGFARVSHLNRRPAATCQSLRNRFSALGPPWRSHPCIQGYPCARGCVQWIWNDQDDVDTDRWAARGPDQWSLPAPPWSARARCARYRPRLEYKLIPCGFLHWGGLQAPGGTLAAIYITLRRYLLIRLQPRLTELELDPTPRATNHRITHRVSRYFTKPIIEYFGRLLDHPARSQSPSAPA